MKPIIWDRLRQWAHKVHQLWPPEQVAELQLSNIVAEVCFVLNSCNTHLRGHAQAPGGAAVSFMPAT